MLSACANTTTVPQSKDQKSSAKIFDNKTDAENAQDEYKKLQEQRAVEE
jgi:hypothetical protein